MCSNTRCSAVPQKGGTGVCYSAEDTLEGNLTTFPDCPMSDGTPLEGGGRPLLGRTIVSSATGVIWPSFHTTKRGRVNDSQIPDRCDGSNSLTLDCVVEPSSLSTSDMSSILVWIWDWSPVSSSRLEVTCEGGADPGRLIQVTQSVCPLPHPPWPEVQVLVNETVREWTLRPKEKNGMDRPSMELHMVYCQHSGKS